jgi:hypothetical protein
MKTNANGKPARATDKPDEAHSPLLDAARAIGTAVGKVSNRLGISKPPSPAPVKRKSAPQTKAKSKKTLKRPAAKKKGPAKPT